jgi:hypothetical protein
VLRKDKQDLQLCQQLARCYIAMTNQTVLLVFGFPTELGSSFGLILLLVFLNEYIVFLLFIAPHHLIFKILKIILSDLLLRGLLTPYNTFELFIKVMS